MVALPDFSVDPTLEKMFEITVASDAKQKPRNYLGASLLGNPCDRSTYYNLIHAPQSEKKHSLIWAAHDGYACENVIADRLRMVPGVELWTHDEDGKQFEFSALDGEFKGHPDGIIRGLLQAPKSNHIWENKAKNQKLFNEFLKEKEKHGEKSCLENWHFEYYVQAQLLMHFFEIDRHYMTVCSAGARDIASCRTEYKKSFALTQIEKAKRLISAKNNKIIPERINSNKSYYLCKWCNFYEHCWKE